LESNVVKNCENIEDLAERIEDKENALGHLDIQREELMENFIKGQKLALSLWVNNKKRTMHAAFSKWTEGVRANNQIDAD
jgi:hypothetical protein